MENKLIIRKARIDDLNSLLSLRKEHFDYEINNLNNKILDRSWIISDNCRDDFKYFILDDNAAIFIAEVDGIPVGYICGEIEKKKEWNKDAFASLTNLYIKEEYRRKNIGKYLVDYFKEYVKDKGLNKIEVNTMVNNDIAINFYEKNGFEKSSIQLILDV